MNTQGEVGTAIMVGLVIAALVIVVTLIAIFPRITHGAEQAGSFLECGASLKGQCLPICPGTMVINPAGAQTCTKMKDDPDTTATSYQFRPEAVLHLTEDQWVNKEYYDESRWSTCCVSQIGS